MSNLEKLFKQCFAEAKFDPSESPTAFRLRVNPRAMEWVKGTFKTFVAETRITKPDQITLNTIQNWIDERAPKEQRWSESLLSTFLHALNTFLHWSKRNGLVETHPASNIHRMITLPPMVTSDIETKIKRFYLEAATFKGNTKDTLRWLRGIFPMFLRDTFVQHETEITRDVVKDWITNGCLERKWQEKTVRNYLQAINLFLDWCVNNEYLDSNPAANLDKPRLPKTKPRALSQEEAVTVLETTMQMPYAYRFEKTRAVAIIATFLLTGVRLMELMNLRMVDIRLEGESPELFVRRGKGKKDRHIPLITQHKQILLDYLEDRERLGRNSEYLFTTLRADARVGVKVIPNLVKRIRHRSGVYFSPHMLRHTCATLLMQGGCNTREVQELLGHASVTTTEMYTNITADHLRKQVGRHPLADMLGPTPNPSPQAEAPSQDLGALLLQALQQQSSQVPLQQLLQSALQQYSQSSARNPFAPPD